MRDPEELVVIDKDLDVDIEEVLVDERVLDGVDVDDFDRLPVSE